MISSLYLSMISTRAGQYDRAYTGLDFDPVECRHQAIDQIIVERVQPLRPVDMETAGEAAFSLTEAALATRRKRSKRQ